MGIGGFFASQAERDHYRYLRHYTAQRVTKTCVGEMEREVSEVLAPVGVDEKTCRAVARCLRDAEAESKGNGTGDGIVPEHASLKWDQDIGLTAFLLKFGQGLGLLIPLFVLFQYFLTHVVRRGNPQSSDVCLRIHHRHGIFDWWFYSPCPLLLHPPRTSGPHILLHCDWNCVACIWRCQSTCDWR